MSRKYNSVDEVIKHREEVEKEFADGLPSYLKDFFDEEELKLKNEEFFKEKALNRYNIPKEEKAKYIEDQREEFWQENEFEIIKKKRGVRDEVDPVYQDVLRNEDRLEDERDLTEEEIKILVAMCEEDLYLFAIRYFSHYLKKPSSPLHKYLYKTLNREINKKNRKRGFKLAVAAPRGNAKSTLVSTIFPLWCIAYNKKNFIIIISDTVSQAADFLSDVKRELEFNVLLQRDFPHLVGKGPIWRADEIITNNNIKVLALGTGSKIRGRRFGIHRPDLLVFDDLESSDMVRSESEREFVRFQWFNKDALHVGGEEGTSTDMLVVGTILGKDSLLNALLDPNEYPDWYSKRFKAVISESYSELWITWEGLYKNRFDKEREKTARDFFEKHSSEMLEGTEVLWPEGDPYYDLMVLKISDQSAFESEKQNNPLDPTRIVVMMDDLRFENFQSNPNMLKILNNKNNPIYGAIDVSLGKKKGVGDYSSITTVVRDISSGYILVVGFDIKRRKVDDQIEAVLKSHLKYKYTLFAVETNAFQLVLSENLRKASRRDGIYVPVKDIENYKDKRMRFETHVPIIKDGTVIFDSYAYNNNQQYRMGVEQITTFTGDDDRYDDAVDSTEMAIRIAAVRKFKRRTKQTGKRLYS